ncbi:hypothetical protein [Variovorax sp. GB1P17]|uniref:hypothetical protein n=1 Tax=Variovorax sp. GB1P17 TaxID=3443740 RepID=UPI003F478D60
MDCYKLVGGALQPMPDPTESHDEGSVEECIRAAGYTVTVCSSAVDAGGGAEITIYETEERDRPRYYIDLMGVHQSIATFVADDFPALLATLKELAPLTAVVGLDQRAWIQAGLESARGDQMQRRG